MSTPYPSLNFGLGEEIDMLRDTVYRFAQAEIAPRAEQIDKTTSSPWICGANLATSACWA